MQEPVDCPRCGRTLRADAAFCEECRLQLRDASEAAVENTRGQREAWVRENPQAAAAYERWAQAPQGPPPGPGAAAAAAAAAPARAPVGPQFLPLGGRAQAVVVCLAAIAAFDVLAVISDLAELSLLDRIESGADVTDRELTNNDSRQSLVGFGQLALVVAGAIVWIRWFHRAYQNVDTIDHHHRRFGTGWAIGGWFVPIMNLWRPKQIANDIMNAGGPGGPGGLLLLWWIVYIVESTLANFAFRLWRDEDSIDGLQAADRLTVASDALDIVAALLAIAVCLSLTRRLVARRAELEEPRITRRVPGAVPLA